MNNQDTKSNANEDVAETMDELNIQEIYLRQEILPKTTASKLVVLISLTDSSISDSLLEGIRSETDTISLEKLILEFHPVKTKRM